MRTAAWGVSFLVVVGFAQVAVAQPQVPGGFQRPSVSPYINLLRGSGVSNSALNYFGIVRPEQQFRQQANMLQQQLNQTNQNLGALASGESGDALLVTGKGATFMNYSHYYPLMGGGGSGAMGSSFNRGGGMGASSAGVGMMMNNNSGRGMSAPSRGGAAPPRGGRR